MSVLTWNSPVTISGFNASDPRTVIDSNGNSTAIWIEQSVYNTGTASQSGTTVTGTGTTFTSSMVGGKIVYANKITANITAFVSSTSLTTTETLTMSDQAYTIYYNGVATTSYLPNAGSWSTATQLSTVGNNTASPKLFVDLTGIVSVLWVENTVVKYASYNGSWSAVTSLSTGTGASSPSMCVDSLGNVVVAWTKSAKTEAIVKPISTGIWSSITTFTTVNSDNPSICIGGAVTTVVWHAKPTNQDQIMASVASAIGGTFSAPTNIVTGTGTGYIHNYPKVTVDTSGNSMAIWYRSNLGGATNADYINVSLLATSLLNGAASWTIATPLSGIGSMNPANLVAKCAHDPVGNVLVLWTSSTTANLFNQESRVRQLGGNLSDTFRLIDSNLTAYDLSLSINTLSGALVCYMYYDGSNSIVQAIETDIGGNPVNTYTTPTTISTTGTNNAHPRASMALNNNTVNAVSVWESYDSDNSTIVIQSAIASKTLLAAPSNLVVTQSTRNFGVFNEYDNNLSWNDAKDSNVIGYNIYRNNLYIAQTPYGYTTMVDNNRAQSGTGVTVTYSIASFDSNYQQGQRINVVIS